MMLARSLVISVLLALIGGSVTATAQPNPSELIVLTTTTTQDSGILRVIMQGLPGEEFCLQIPAHCGHRFRRIADSVPVIADSRR